MFGWISLVQRAYATRILIAAALSAVTLSACSGPGGSVIAPGPTPPAKFAYVTNEGSNNVSAYTINAASGALTSISGSPFAAGSAPGDVAVDPLGKFVYVANGGSNNISVYTINPASGVLTPVAGSPFPAGSSPAFVAVNPSGKFAYVTNVGSKNVSAYAINPASGALTPVVGSPFATGNNPRGVTVDPSDKFVYVVNEADNNVSAYTIDLASGALTPVAGSPFATGANFPFGVAVDPSSKFAYVVNGGSCNVCESVSAYTINAASGALTLVAGSPFAAGAYSAGGVAVEPSGKFVYVTDEQGSASRSILAYSINPGSGALTQVSGSPFVGGSILVAVDSTGKFAYSTSNDCDCVVADAINANTGALTPVAGSPFPTGAIPSGIAVARTQ